MSNPALAQGRFDRLVGSGRLGAHIAGRKQRGIRRAEAGTRLSDTSGCLRDVEILFERQGDEARQLRIIEAGPPCGEVGLAVAYR